MARQAGAWRVDRPQGSGARPFVFDAGALAATTDENANTVQQRLHKFVAWHPSHLVRSSGFSGSKYLQAGVVFGIFFVPCLPDIIILYFSQRVDVPSPTLIVTRKKHSPQVLPDGPVPAQ